MERKFDVSRVFDNSNKLIDAYHKVLQPLCKETGIPPLALDILLFFANQDENMTANDVCRLRGFKSGIVSVHIDRLVTGGLLERRAVPGDRRKTNLVPTQNAMPIIEKGRELQLSFGEKLLQGIDASDIAVWEKIMMTIDKNVADVREHGLEE